jgi:hypothetical protein
MVQRIVHLLFAYLPPNLTAESAQLRVSRERPIAQAHPEAEILLRIRRMLHDDTRSIHYCVPHRLPAVLRHSFSKINAGCFHCHDDGRWFYCFVCLKGFSGRGAIDFVKLMQTVDFQEATEFLRRYANIAQRKTACEVVTKLQK